MIVADYYVFMLVFLVSVRLSYVRPAVILFSGDNCSKYQRIFAKLDVSVDLAEICFEIANEQISSMLDSYIPAPL